MRSKIRAAFSYPMEVLRPVRDFLLGEKKRLKKVTKELESEDPYNDPRRVNDNAAVDTDVSEHADHDRLAAVMRETHKSLINIRKSLTRIKLGKYGVCIKCGQMIDTDRLSIKPTAEFCVSCEREAEKNGKK
jgi:RNA polymerase-binding transcription factor DksA